MSFERVFITFFLINDLKKVNGIILLVLRENFFEKKKALLKHLSASWVQFRSDNLSLTR